MGSRIMTVADVFTAITEDRPYRKGMPYEKTVRVLNSMIDKQALCPYVVSLLIDNYELINGVRIEAQRIACIEYNYFMDYDKGA